MIAHAQSQVVAPDFWAGKRVFMTGHTGFKGGWLSEWLLEMGAELCGYALAPVSEGTVSGFAPFFEELELSGRMTHVIGDIRDSEKMTRALLDFDPEIVIHMAAQPLVRLSYREPVETYDVNVMGTVRLLEACRQLKNLKTIQIVTSDKCYDNREQIWGYREHDPMGGFDPYSNSKGCAELVTSAYRNSFFHPDAYDDHGVSVCSGRAGNVIGGGDWSLDRLIPDAMRAHCTGNALTIRAPHAIRPWQHVLEPLSGYLTLIQASYESPRDVAQGWNFGPRDSEAMNVRKVMTVLQEHLGDGFSWTEQVDPQDLHEATWLKLDCTAALEWLGWAPRFTTSEALGMTAQWYGSSDPAARRQIVSEQISRMLSPLAA